VYYSRKASEISPYTPGEQPERPHIKINTNENPYPPSPLAMAAAREAIGVDGAALRRYSDPESSEVRQAVADAEKAAGADLGPENVFIGNGADDVLSMCFQAFFPPAWIPEEAGDGDVLIPDLTYTFYQVYGNLYNAAFRLVPLNDAFEIATADYLIPNGGVIFANPNAPTGIYKPLAEIEPILEYNLGKSVVVVDEAYIAFGGSGATSTASAALLVPRYPNLLVVRTLSKSHALAGLRVGYALGQPSLIQGLNRIKDSVNPYAVDYLAQKIAAAALKDQAYYAGITERVVATRERVAQGLRSIGFTVLPSSANFVLAVHPEKEGREIYRQLSEEGIWVRHFEGPRISPYIRVSIGTDEEMDVFLESCRRIIGREDA
jgi:histidinol-phosphate aminotransferase